VDQTPDQPQVFYDAAAATLHDAGMEVIKNHPEVRSLVVVFDYNKDLNDARIPHAIWIGGGPDGQLTTPEAILGSGYQLLKMLRAVAVRAEEVLRLREKQIVDASKRLLELEKQIADKQTEGPATGAP
jgi:hypothetical protein